MIKPEGYDEVNVGGEYTPVELGAHYAKIISVREQMSSTGKEMIVAAIDFDSKDAQKDFFKERFENDSRADKKWPNQAVQYIVCTDNAGKCNRSFKSFLTSVEDSNSIKIDWESDDFTKQFKNKKIGVVYGEVEEEYNGEVKMRRKIRWFCNYNKVEAQKIPEVKYLNAPASFSAPQRPSTPSNDGFMPAGQSEDIPF